jgi:hypothetical protein
VLARCVRCAFGAGSLSAPHGATVTWGGTDGTTPQGYDSRPWMGLRGFSPRDQSGVALGVGLAGGCSARSRGVAVGAAVRNWLSGGSTMTGEPGAKGAPRPFTDERAQGQDVLGLGERERDYLLAWVGENLTLVRRSAFGQRILYWSLGIGFAVGLAAHVGGFLLKSSATTEPLLLI